MQNLHFNFKGDDCIIRERKVDNGSNKTPLYIYNLSKVAYVSGLQKLKNSGEENIFYFQPMGTSDYYLLSFRNNEIMVNQVQLKDIATFF